MPNEEVARKIQERSVLINEMINVLSQSNEGYEDLVKKVDVPALEQILDKKQKFRFAFEGVGKKMS